ncbi:MAG: type 4a pilus biogenesis protein PilO [Gemmatimonadetes bacterium]|nr:type 4a pilus biogenesis protein PilO [Gemmatimonadota bacterium]
MALIPSEPKQRGALLIGILAVGLLYLFWSYWYTPKQLEVADLEAQFGQLEFNNQRAQIISARGGTELQEKLALYERHVGQLERLIPQQEEFVALLNDITAESRRQGVMLTSLSPEAEEVGAFYTKESYEIQVVGDFHDLGRFLGTIASLPRIVTPMDLDLAPFEGDVELLSMEFEAPLVASLRIQTYILPAFGAPPPVEGGEGQVGITQ